MTRSGNGCARRPQKRRVAVVTGTRADYGLLQTVLQAIDDHPRLKLQVVAAGIHLLKKFGRTVDVIERDGWKIDATIPMQTGDDDPLDQARGLAKGIAGIAEFLQRARTDIVLVLGDRIEAMAGALAATTTGRFLAHIHGGDRAPGDLDNVLRDAITKSAHIHLPATDAAARRLIAMGENPDHVHTVGAPGLDRLLVHARASSRTRRSEAEVLVVHHPSGRTPAVEQRVMRACLRALRKHGLSSLVVYPNTDRGHSGVLAAIEAERTSGNGKGRMRVVRSLDREDYLDRLTRARMLIGNSSSGIIEAPAVGTVSVNIGARQAGRLRAANTVVDCRESYTSISDAVARALRMRPRIPARTPYGDGRAGVRIARTLAATRLSDPFRRKTAPN